MSQIIFAALIPLSVLVVKQTMTRFVFNYDHDFEGKSIIPYFFCKRIITPSTLSFDFLCLCFAILLINISNFEKIKSHYSFSSGLEFPQIFLLHVFIVLLFSFVITVLLRVRYKVGSLKELEFKNDELDKYKIENCTSCGTQLATRSYDFSCKYNHTNKEFCKLFNIINLSIVMVALFVNISFYTLLDFCYSNFSFSTLID